MSQGRGNGGHYAVCDCCDLEFLARDALPWRERNLARRLKVLGAPPQPSVGGGSGPYAEYWVEQEHRVCPTCHADLMAGGRFRALHRNRSKLAVLAVVAALALLIAALPVLLPHLMSALYMLPHGRPTN